MFFLGPSKACIFLCPPSCRVPFFSSPRLLIKFPVHIFYSFTIRSKTSGAFCFFTVVTLERGKQQFGNADIGSTHYATILILKNRVASVTELENRLQKVYSKLHQTREFLHRQRYRVTALFAILILAALPSDGLTGSICPFKNLTGMDGPACRLTRSMSSGLHFNLTKSVAYHPLGLLVLLYLLAVVWRNRPDPASAFIPAESWARHLFRFRFVAALFVFFWIFRVFL